MTAAEKTVPIDQIAEWVRNIEEAHAIGAEADAGFDGGEFSGPAHDRAMHAEIEKLAEAHGYTVDEVWTEVNRQEAEEMEGLPAFLFTES